MSDVVHRFKTMTTKRYADNVRHHGWPRFRGRLWQRNYYEHVIRNERELDRIREYIVTNPLKWALDRENLQRTGQSDEEDALFDVKRRRTSYQRSRQGQTQSCNVEFGQHLSATCPA